MLKTHKEIPGYTLYSNYSGYMDYFERKIPCTPQLIKENINKRTEIPLEAIYVIENEVMGYGYSAYVSDEFTHHAKALHDHCLQMLDMLKSLDDKDFGKDSK